MTSVTHHLSAWELALVREHPALFVVHCTFRYAGTFAIGILLAATASRSWSVAGQMPGIALLLAASFGLIAGFVLLTFARRNLAAAKEQSPASPANSAA